MSTSEQAYSHNGGPDCARETAMPCLSAPTCDDADTTPELFANNRFRLHPKAVSASVRGGTKVRASTPPPDRRASSPARCALGGGARMLLPSDTGAPKDDPTPNLTEPALKLCRNRSACTARSRNERGCVKSKGSALPWCKRVGMSSSARCLTRSLAAAARSHAT